MGCPPDVGCEKAWGPLMVPFFMFYIFSMGLDYF